MKNKIFIFILSFLLTNCTEKKKAEVKIKKPYDESYIAVFDYYIHNADYTESTKVSLNAKEIVEVDLIFKEAIKDYNNHPERHIVIAHKPEGLNLKEYKRQYFPGFNEKGEKEVSVECVHNHVAKGNSWKEGRMVALGGGEYFFRVLINLSNRKFYNFTTNDPG